MDNMLKREADGLQQVKAGQLNMMGGGGDDFTWSFFPIPSFDVHSSLRFLFFTENSGT